MLNKSQRAYFDANYATHSHLLGEESNVEEGIFMLLKTNMNEISVGAVKDTLGNAIKFAGGVVLKHKLASALIFVFLIKIAFLTVFYHSVLIHQKVKIDASGMAHDLISDNQKF